MRNDDLSKLTYLAQAVVADPEQFDRFVGLVRDRLHASGETADRHELEDALDALVKAWKRFRDHRPTTAEIVELATDLERKRGEAIRLAGIALQWAAENQLWRRQHEAKELDESEERALADLSDRAAAPGF